MTSSFKPSGDSDPPPIGVHFVHQYYPGFIDVRPHSLYLIDGEGLRGGIHVLRHVRPLVVTDFANELIRVHADDGAVHTRLARPISDIDQASNAIDAKGLERFPVDLSRGGIHTGVLI